jgi:alkanesulfonate monooxygenase SsuD/methylene tetrahydromethanopterin reductase-like flavin-dependent oxidoreductase (luciferase family)
LKIDVFCEVEKARPWGPGHEYQLMKETLSQAQAADDAGFDCWWQVEHHTAEEMSYSSAPDVMLSAIAQRTKRIRVGHSAVLAPHNFAHPIRIAERAATLDLLSDGRLEMGFARSTIPEWRVFQIPPEDTKAQLKETLRMVPQMWLNERFTYKSNRFEINDRPIIPKPLQKPHPPLWMAAGSPDSFQLAGQNGIGVLGVTIFTPIDAMGELLAMYREAIKTCDPAGAFINNQTGVFTFVHCAETTKKAIENGAAEAAAWYCNTIVEFFELQEMMRSVAETGKPSGPEAAGAGLVAPISAPTAPTAPTPPPDPNQVAAMQLVAKLARNEHVSGEEVYEVLNAQDSVIIGDPETCRKKMERYRDIGCDRLLCFQQVGALSHDSILESIRLVGRHLIPQFSPK